MRKMSAALPSGGRQLRRAWATVAVLALLSACARQPKPAEPPKEYRLRGVVVSLDAEHRVATIKHEKIEGWMDAMTMGFPVKDPQEFARLTVGAAIQAKVVVAPSGVDYWLEQIAMDDQPAKTNPGP